MHDTRAHIQYAHTLYTLTFKQAAVLILFFPALAWALDISFFLYLFLGCFLSLLPVCCISVLHLLPGVAQKAK